ncbi:MAG: UDP-N-acetylmuramoyl-tripeptide--D-alanyl-D-alanine ligase [Bacteriovoracaceae bacterium]|jgi:UDP-N-acetylmuramoyl-tripeptide--D-alanyl-D-alanine ligase|nr:UDP-N-acetylmuramoyl-tripeptide--D-alanyl-D-alanine ligase [Bacteriovoracaceae bacterium]
MISINEIRSLDSFIKTNFSNDSIIYISTNSKEIKKNESFLAIKGKKFDAINFVEDALKKCSSFIYSYSEENEKMIDSFKKNNYICVTDTTVFIQEYANLIAKKIKFNGGNIIALSGSNGKTTTRQMLYYLIKKIEKNTITTQANNNNHLGVPFTLLQASKETKNAIIELGSNKPGEIKLLCEICNPNIGVTTNIGYTHLEFFDSLENVYKEEGYLAEYISNEDKFFVNMDDSFLKELVKKHKNYDFGFNGKNYQFTYDNSQLKININEQTYNISNQFITGKHNFFNLGVAFIISSEIYPQSKKDLAHWCSSFKPTENRSEWKSIGQSLVYLDAYNSNPSSVHSSVLGFLEKNAADETLFIIGDMNELGSSSKEMHCKIGEFLKNNNINNTVFIGRHADDLYKGCGRGRTYRTAKEYSVEFLADLKKFKKVFIKGSRSLQLESIIDITLD